MWLHNFGVNQRSKDQGYVYIWTKVEGREGSREVASFFIKFFNKGDMCSIKRVQVAAESVIEKRQSLAFFLFALCELHGLESWEH